MTQADLAFEAGVSPRHLSFVETGRASPSRKLVLARAAFDDDRIEEFAAAVSRFSSDNVPSSNQKRSQLGQACTALI